MALGVNTIGTGELRNNVAGLAKPSDVYDIPAVLTSIGREYNGPLFEEITLSMNTILSRLS
ncbi:cysteine hydrolase family protein [Haloarchaeobius iranensis]|uniref:Uncharacterized protein n=2 Tax=Haloarchaeobius iranensis TaxID=996166 RepID=A0A1G9ZKJ2_9EURY|nr:hypothetical protein [Haloarchaeobius iranensis]SDN21838.1 hypothetical protein SAMN05192554_1213 [Haloarchaeobius iranensis]